MAQETKSVGHILCLSQSYNEIPPFTVRLVVIHCNLRLTNDSRLWPDIAWESSLAYVNVSMCLELVAKRQRKVCSSLTKSIVFDNLDMPAPPRG